MRVQLSDHFTYKKLLQFIFPSVIMMLFTSIYVVVDGVFVSIFVGKTALAAVSFAYPIYAVFSALSFMLGTGGSALVGKYLGEQKRQKANRCFSFITYTTIISAILLTVLGLIFFKPIALLLGAEGLLLKESMKYGNILLFFSIFYMLQIIFQFFLITAEKPMLNLKITIIAGLTNMVFDYVFIGLFKWGIEGAGYATILSQFIGGVIPLIYFSFKNTSLLKLTKTRFNLFELQKSASNGISELISNLSNSVVTIIYNVILLKVAGENGIAAYGVIMYITFFFHAVFIGFSYGSAPLFSYNYGAKNSFELKNLFKKCMRIIGIGSILLVIAAEVLSSPLSKIFVGYDNTLQNMTLNGLRIYSVSFLLIGFNLFASSFFTALNNGLISFIISFLRTFVFQLFTVSLLPLFLDLNGIWMAVIVAEILSVIVSLFFFIKNRKKYNYL